MGARSGNRMAKPVCVLSIVICFVEHMVGSPKEFTTYYYVYARMWAEVGRNCGGKKIFTGADLVIILPH